MKFKQRRGVAIIYVIVISGIVSLIIGVMMTRYILHRQSIMSSFEKIRMFYTAEAGIKKAYYYLQEDETKGFTWRTGNLIEDEPLSEHVFYQREDEVMLSVVDDCGFLRIKSRAKGKFPKTISVLVASTIPEDMRDNLHVSSPKPLILNAGSQLKGTVKLNHEPLFHGGGIDGVLETNPSLPFPGIINTSFVNSIHYFRYLLSTPHYLNTELFSAQVFSPENPLPGREIFVNDAVLIENRDTDSVWQIRSDIIIVSTAEVQISGFTEMRNATIIAIGPVRILDNAELRLSRIYSETSIELRQDTRFSGVLIAPEIHIAERAQILNPSTVYCGSPLKQGRMMFYSELPVYCTVINLCSDKNSMIEIADHAKINGFIYSQAPITHKGEISGFVYCKGFHDEPVTQDTLNTNIISGIIKPIESVESMSLPVIFQTVEAFKTIQWQEF
jgi:hypothetical protein